jgi:hypothetical protein
VKRIKNNSFNEEEKKMKNFLKFGEGIIAGTILTCIAVWGGKKIVNHADPETKEEKKSYSASKK